MADEALRLLLCFEQDRKVQDSPRETGPLQDME
jgi:hypothetical protein